MTAVAHEPGAFAGKPPKTLLISMPFYSALRPSLQICGLAAIAKAQGFAVDTLHLSVDLAARIGTYLNEELGTFGGYEIGNWLFAPYAFPDAVPDPGDRFPYDYADVTHYLKPYNVDAARLVEMRRKDIPAFLDDVFDATDWASYDVVGFSSTFQQNVPSFALARRIKAAFPRITILFGGANFEGEMGDELVRANPFIDYAVDGEGDVVFVEMLTALAEGRDVGALAGVISRKGRGTLARRPFAELSTAPVPEYGEYFDRADRLGVVPIKDRQTVRVPFEGSRGCWWGEKHHCTFCGLNGQTMKFRQKSGAQVLDDLAEMSRRWGVFNFAGVDNIMATDFWREFVPRVADQGLTYRLFFEVKSNLTRAQVKALSEAGIVEIQPGIESLSSHVLKLMKKGVRGIQNVNLMRWARYYDISLNWNLLFGFPGETEADYAAQTTLMGHLRHLEAPTTAGRIWMERFSPIFDKRDVFPVRFMQPLDHLRYIYPEEIDLNRIAYYFDYAFEESLPDALYDPYVREAHAWRDGWRAGVRPELSYRYSPGVLQITDGRDGDVKRYDFPSPLAEIYHAISDRPLTAGAVAARTGLKDTVDEVAEALDVLAARGLVMRDGELFLALALPARSR